MHKVARIKLAIGIGSKWTICVSSFKIYITEISLYGSSQIFLMKDINLLYVKNELRVRIKK